MGQSRSHPLVDMLARGTLKDFGVLHMCSVRWDATISRVLTAVTRCVHGKLTAVSGVRVSKHVTSWSVTLLLPSH